jgi:hypothetical protein
MASRAKPPQEPPARAAARLARHGAVAARCDRRGPARRSSRRDRGGGRRSRRLLHTIDSSHRLAMLCVGDRVRLGQRVSPRHLAGLDGTIVSSTTVRPPSVSISRSGASTLAACAARRRCSKSRRERGTIGRAQRCHWLCPGNEWAMEGAEPCCGLRNLSESRIRRLCRRFGLPHDTARASRTAMARKGSPVRVRQRALRKGLELGASRDSVGRRLRVLASWAASGPHARSKRVCGRVRSSGGTARVAWAETSACPRPGSPVDVRGP